MSPLHPESVGYVVVCRSEDPLHSGMGQRLRRSLIVVIISLRGMEIRRTFLTSGLSPGTKEQKGPHNRTKASSSIIVRTPPRSRA